MSHAAHDAPEGGPETSLETGLGAGLSVLAAPVEAAVAERIARDHYGLAGTATALLGEKDSNFRLETGPGSAFFLKILTPGEDPAVSRMHGEALAHVAARAGDLPLPRLVRARDGAPDLRVTLAPGDTRTVRVTTFMPGRPHSAGPRTDGQRRGAGVLLARLQRALADFTHPAQTHDIAWDLRHAGRLRGALALFPDDGRRARLARALDAFTARIAPALPDLPHQVVHNDLGGGNILIDPDNPDRITGLIDFGDMVRTARLFDVAIAAAYQLGPDAAPLGPVLTFLRGYASVEALSPAEIALLPTAIETRMALRLLIPEWRAQRFPGRRDDLTRNAAAVWHQFASLDAMAPGAIAAGVAAAFRP